MLLSVRAQNGPDIRHGDGAGPRLGWAVILLVGVRIRPGEQKQGQSQPRDGWAGPRGWMGEAGQNQ